jgi:hypothetical protein
MVLLVLGVPILVLLLALALAQLEARLLPARDGDLQGESRPPPHVVDPVAPGLHPARVTSGMSNPL